MAGVKILPYTGVDDGLPRIREEQEAAIVRMMNEPTHAILQASNMSTGKTVMAAELVIRLGLERVLYIGVKDTFSQWEECLALQSDGKVALRRIDATKPGKANLAAFLAGESGHFFSGAQFLTSQDWLYQQQQNPAGVDLTKIDARHPAGVATFSVTTDGIVKPTIKLKIRSQAKIFAKMKRPVEMIVFDEVHVVANRKSIGRKTLVSIPTDWKVAMSGTFYGNKFENCWSITRWLWPDEIESAFARWKPEWCLQEVVYLPGGEEQWQVTGEKNPGAFVLSLPCYIRLDGELEVPEAEVVYVDLLPEQRADYDALQENLLVYLMSSAGKRVCLVRDIPITLRSGLRAASLGVMSLDREGKIYYADDTMSTKLYALRQIVDRPDWQGKTVGIYTENKQFAKVVVKRMQKAGYNAELWDGDLSSKKRDEVKARFLRGEIRFLVSTIQSFSTGLDGFQLMASRVIWISEADSNFLNNQAIRRYFRTGRADGFAHAKIVARNTYDEGVLSRKIMETIALNQSISAGSVKLAA